jgi:DsbC/DsbD-like thiol-disulfide interchange protein
MSMLRCFSLALLAMPAAAVAQESHVATPWQKAQSSEARLIAPLPAPPGTDGWHYGAVQLTLPKDAKTYWRTAGETGVPPTFSFDGSRGIAAPEVLFPAPVAFDDGIGGVAYGYLGGAIFPFRFKAGGGAPYTLAVSVDYGVCLKTMCVPAQAKLAIAPQGSGEPGLADAVQDARKRVPVLLPLGAAAPLAVQSLSAALDKDGLTLAVKIAGEAEMPAVFVEGDEVFTPVGSGERAGRITIHRFRAQRTGEAKRWGDIRITVATDALAIETSTNLDAAITR